MTFEGDPGLLLEKYRYNVGFKGSGGNYRPVLLVIRRCASIGKL